MSQKAKSQHDAIAGANSHKHTPQKENCDADQNGTKKKKNQKFMVI